MKIVKKISFQEKFEKKLSALFYRSFDCGSTWSYQNFNFLNSLGARDKRLLKNCRNGYLAENRIVSKLLKISIRNFDSTILRLELTLCQNFTSLSSILSEIKALLNSWIKISKNHEIFHFFSFFFFNWTKFMLAELGQNFEYPHAMPGHELFPMMSVSISYDHYWRRRSSAYIYTYIPIYLYIYLYTYIALF